MRCWRETCSAAEEGDLPPEGESAFGKGVGFAIYSPCRTAMVLAKVSKK